MESMKAVALAAKARSPSDFQKAVKAYKVHGELVILVACYKFYKPGPAGGRHDRGEAPDHTLQQHA